MIRTRLVRGLISKQLPVARYSLECAVHVQVRYRMGYLVDQDKLIAAISCAACT